MAINSYATLNTALQNWYMRTDSTFTDRIDEFIALCEDRIHHGSGEDGDPLYSPPLRVLGMESSADLTINTQSVSQPTGFLEAKRLYINDDPIFDVDFMPPDRFWSSDIAGSNTNGKPVLYTIEGSNFVFAYTPDTTYTGKLLYYGKLDLVTDLTNWLLTNSPKTYLYGSLLEAAIWDEDDQRAVKYNKLFSDSVKALNNQDKTARTSGSTLRVQADQSP